MFHMEHYLKIFQINSQKEGVSWSPSFFILFHLLAFTEYSSFISVLGGT
jgi:hypothetical protein